MNTEATRIREPTILGDSMGRKHEISPEDLQRIQQGGFEEPGTISRLKWGRWNSTPDDHDF